MHVSEYKKGGDATTITFESDDTEFEIFITPYGKSTVSADQFKKDEPSGAKDLKNITIDGVRATAFFGQNPITLWVIHEKSGSPTAAIFSRSRPIGSSMVGLLAS